MTSMLSFPTKQRLIIAASTIGKTHVSRNMPNQDAYLVEEFENGFCLAVADGVGSDTNSEFASKAAVEAVRDVFINYTPEMLNNLHKLLCDSFNVKMQDAPVASSGTTCIFCVYLYEQGLFLGQVGDGICSGFVDGEPFVLAEKESDFSNLVHPLVVDCQPNLWKIIHFQGVASIELMLATDGVADDILPGKAPNFSRYLISLVAEFSEAERQNYLTDILQNWETPNSNDDKTIILCKIN